MAKTNLFSPVFACELEGHYNWRSDVVDCPWCKLDAAQKRYEEYAGLCFACTPYLKERETPAECIQRNRNDGTQMLGMLAKERKELEAAKSRLDEALNAGEELRQKGRDAWEVIERYLADVHKIDANKLPGSDDMLIALTGIRFVKPTAEDLEICRRDLIQAGIVERLVSSTPCPANRGTLIDSTGMVRCKLCGDPGHGTSIGV